MKSILHSGRSGVLPLAPAGSVLPASCARVRPLDIQHRRRQTHVSAAALPGGNGGSSGMDPEELFAAELRAQASLHRASSAAHLLKPSPPVGSQWGEGFLQFRPGEALRLDVDTLNEKLQHRGAARLRHVQAPDEAFGLIFNFDGCVGNTRGALVRAAAELAERCSRPPLLPHQQQALALRSTSTERMFIDILGWADNMKDAQHLSYQLSELYANHLAEMVEPMRGLREWLAALAKFNVPCAVVSSLDRVTVTRLLQRMGLHDFFMCMVTGDADMETVSQRLLSVAMQLNRPPNHCVYFGDSPNDVIAAHNCTMKAVAVCSAYPAYQLKQADLTVAQLSDLTVYNVRRLFAAQGAEFMELRQQISNDNNKNKKRRTVNGTL